ncbi:MAG: hypothetical protein ACR2LJ_01965 [Acidimicrobiales bacterium]
MLPLIAVETAAIVLLGLLVLGLLRSHAEILRRLHSLGAGLDPDLSPDASPTLPLGTLGSDLARRPPRRGGSTSTGSDVSGITVTDEPVSIGVVGARQDTLLAFLTTGCLTCNGFWDVFRTGRHLAVPGGARLVVVVKGPDQESQSRLTELAPTQVPVVRSNEAWSDYEVPVAPYFVYVEGPSGRVIGEGAGQTWDQVSSLLGQALADAEAMGARPPRPAEHRPAAPEERLDTEARSDRDLAKAGILPGHPSLYPAPKAPPATAQPQPQPTGD